MKHPYQRAKFACFFCYLSMSSVFCLPPMLFLTFRETYGISFTLLGTLVLVNFCTQLLVDLALTFFTKHFQIHRTIRIMPLLTTLGLVIYALVPTFCPRFAYAGLVVGTVIFSLASGLSEVLLSPLVAAIPSEHPERDMSALHSLYAYGVLTVVAVSTGFFALFGTQSWMYLTLFWAVLPVVTFLLFSTSTLPPMNLEQDPGQVSQGRSKYLLICAACIFLGSAAENSMTNWISGYLESALKISKTACDLLGIALFAMLLGLTRTAYAKLGRKIYPVLLVGMAGAAGCYLVAGLAGSNIACLAACALTGMFTAMLWPGTLILMEEKIPSPGVAAYALMAACGDFGASVAPQLLGIVVDKVSASPWAADAVSGLSSEQVGMKAGMLIASAFPIAGTVLLICAGIYFRKRKNA